MTTDSKKEKTTASTDEVIAALNEAQMPRIIFYPFKFIDGTELSVPCRKLGHAMSLEGARGEKYLDTEKELVDPDRQRRIWVKRMNLGLLDGWKIVDDLMTAPNPPHHDPDNKKVAVSLISSGDWATLEAVIFPGSESNDSASVSKRANAIMRGSV